ncbi:MAG: hypothetical protein FD131_4992 [Rhodocyclaceae bacterium]|nr:MAG: hypothetical protein FD131_4992 [Rhodocyclaceae bacterium]
MSLQYIRKTYGVPAKRGMRIRYTDGAGVIWNGAITFAKGPHLRVLVDDRVPGYRGRLILHPTDSLEYIQADDNPVPNRQGSISEPGGANP